ncbi:energy-coupling factor ABC transporter permease [Peptostreptococcus sp.]|uniref:energy-coupling factor ABC transporter permease n=1 Tax=Peptostreptococcus sp. TaxID=1262 RepID=UPI002FC90B88
MSNYSRKEKRLLFSSLVLSFFMCMLVDSSAMHIMEGYLPAIHCVVWAAICLPFLVLGVINIKKTVKNSPKTIMILAMSGAFIFVVSSLKIPSVTGSCSHMTGTGLAAILFGVTSSSVLGIIVLIFQAILLAHGGLTTLGANTFSMAIAGPIAVYLLYNLGKKLKVNRRLNIFIAAALGDLITYCVTSIQLAVAYPSPTGGVAVSMAKFLAVFAPTQVPLAIIEGILTVLIIIGLESYAVPELEELNYYGEV